MTVELQFVENMTTTAIRLNVNDGAKWHLLAEGTDFGLPELRRSVVETMLQDGAQVPSSAYGNRELILRWLVSGDFATLTSELQALYRELERPTNYLRYKLHSTSPVWFRTFRSAPSLVQFVASGERQWEVTARIMAEPFALGAEEFAFSAQSINQNPAGPGMYIDVSSVKGDAETPLVISSTDGASLYASVFAVRRRGTVANVPFLLQAESMTLGTDTTLPGNDAAMSGAGSNYARTSFSTTTAMTQRLSLAAHPSVASTDARGNYLVCGRFRRSSATGAIDVKFGENTTVSTMAVTTPHILSLGLISIPNGGGDPVAHGPSGVELPVQGISLTLQAERLSGTATLDCDYLLFVPADDLLCAVSWPAGGASGTVGLDGTRDVVFRKNVGGAIESHNGFHLGGAPMVTPGITNRLFFVKSAATPSSSDMSAITLTATYWPRYLSVRPLSS